MASIPYSGQEENLAVVPPFFGGPTGLANLPMTGQISINSEALIAAHSSSTAGVHGISDTANLEYLTNKNTANGYAGLGADGKISLNLLPDANALESEAIAFAIALG